MKIFLISAHVYGCLLLSLMRDKRRQRDSDISGLKFLFLCTSNENTNSKPLRAEGCSVFKLIESAFSLNNLRIVYSQRMQAFVEYDVFNAITNTFY